MRTVTSLTVTEKTVGPKYDPNTSLGNWDSNRTNIDRIIIHTMVGYAQGADERFNDASSNVSSHYGVLENGEIWHWVDEDKNAYHCGDYPTNERSIGIEFEDNGQPNAARPDALYTTGAALIREVAQYYNIPIDRAHIQKHSEVSDRPTSCPDALDIDRLVSLANNPQADPMTTCRNDRDLNWNCYVLLLKQLALTPNPNNKMIQAQQAAAKIQSLQQKIVSVTSQVAQQVNDPSKSATQALGSPPVSSSQTQSPAQTAAIIKQFVQDLLDRLSQL